MLQKRKSIFETNSSSTHAITIANNNDNDFKNNLPVSLTFDVGEFGWEFERYDDTQTKANYLFTGILYNEMIECLDKIKNILEKWNIEVIFPELVEVKSEYSDCKYYKLKGEESRWFYVDHSSELTDFINQVCDDEILLMNYLFSPESFVATGNDNDDMELDCGTNAKNVLLDYYKGN